MRNVIAHFTNKNLYCKHIYETVLSVKYSEQREEKEKLENEEVFDKVMEQTENFKKYNS